MARERFIPDRIGNQVSSASPFPARGEPRSASNYRRLDPTLFEHTEDPMGRAANDAAAYGATMPGGATSQAAVDPDELLRQQLDQLAMQAQEEGFVKGLEEGKEQAKQEFAQQLDQLTKSIGDFTQMRAQFIASYREEMAELALHIAQSLVMHRLQDGEKTITKLIDHAIRALDVHEQLQLHLCPDDAARCSAWLEHALARYPSLQVIEDHHLSMGDIRVSSRGGDVTCLLEERLLAVRRLVLGEEPPEED